MRISDWSSDVCSSDLGAGRGQGPTGPAGARRTRGRPGRPSRRRRQPRRGIGERGPMISRFFIDRPVFASVLSIVIVLAGLMAMRALPIAQYPEILPPEVVVSADYPGDSAEVIATTVAAPLAQPITGFRTLLTLPPSSPHTG